MNFLPKVSVKVPVLKYWLFLLLMLGYLLTPLPLSADAGRVDPPKKEQQLPRGKKKKAAKKRTTPRVKNKNITPLMVFLYVLSLTISLASIIAGILLGITAFWILGIIGIPFFFFIFLEDSEVLGLAVLGILGLIMFVWGLILGVIIFWIFGGIIFFPIFLTLLIYFIIYSF